MTRSRLPITTLHPGELVVVVLRGKPTLERINSWGGTVVAGDGIAVRLTAEWFKCGIWPHAPEGERVIPWSTIAQVEPIAAEDGGEAEAA